MPLSRELREGGQPEALLSFIERRVKQAVISGELLPGAKLSPNTIAADLGVSHIPVREALTSLAASGYLEHRPRVGFFVRALSAADLADIYRWRELLEAEAFRMAIPQLTTSDFAQMRELTAQMRPLTDAGRWPEYLPLNRQFHFVAFQRAGSARLLRFLEYLWDAAAPYTSAGVVGSPASQRDHDQMITELEARDVDAVIKTMTRHRGAAVDAVARWEARARGES